PPPPPPPQPMFMPMPGFESFMQQQQQRPPGTPSRSDRDQPKKPADATPKPATPAKESPKGLRRKLRRLAYTAFFLASLNRLTNENKFRPRFDFLFDVRLKEMLETLHRIYKTPDGPLYSVTFATVMGDEAMELTELMNVPKTLSKDEERVVAQELAYCIENTPTKGILGTHRKSGVFEMIRSGNLFPKGYFYDMEKNAMEFDDEGRTSRVTDCNARMLLIGLFLMRALVETLYLKTEHYGMVVETTQKAERNIRLVSTLLTYIYRKVVGQLVVMDQGTKKARVSIPDVPSELSGVMHTDQEIRPVIRVVKKSLDYANNLLMHWSEEYVKRLRGAGFT
uniref:MAGE domain-containing protein n=1 Tax=Macrostomum lignano TaxID=282301 RepID=A0A1I8IHU8_9PLAT